MNFLEFMGIFYMPYVAFIIIAQIVEMVWNWVENK